MQIHILVFEFIIIYYFFILEFKKKFIFVKSIRTKVYDNL